jgi:hypothetical protein
MEPRHEQGSARAKTDRRSARIRQAPVTATVNANGITLGVECFGDEAAPLVLLAGGTTIQNGELLSALVRGGLAFLGPATVNGRFSLRACFVNLRNDTKRCRRRDPGSGSPCSPDKVRLSSTASPNRARIGRFRSVDRSRQSFAGAFIAVQAATDVIRGSRGRPKG